MYPPVFLIHTCSLIKRRQNGKDAFGNPTYEESKVEDIRCRFTGTTAALSGSGYVTTAKCSMSGRTDVEEDDIITTNTHGNSKRYWVNFVKQIYEPTLNTLSHTILELRETAERERV